MNSVIEAQLEYQNFCYHIQIFITPAVTHLPGYYTRGHAHRRACDRREAEDNRQWRHQNQQLVETHKGLMWDQKLRNNL